MKFPQIQIRAYDIIMDWKVQDPVQTIRQPKAEQHIEQPAAILEIHSTPAKLLIDTTQARRDIGLIGPLESTMNYAQEGKKAALEGMARRASEGRQMMENAGKGLGRQTIRNIAKQNHGPKLPKYNIKFVPSIGSVKIDYVPGDLKINAIPQKPKIDVQVNKPIHEYTPGKITGEVLQYPRVEIDVIL